MVLKLTVRLDVDNDISKDLRYAQDNLGVKKVSAPSKNPSNCPIMSFAR
jgi:hypothetical protein